MDETPTHHGIDFDDTTLADLHHRLRRIEGQVRGIQQMLTDGRDCRELVTQIAAATKALEQVGFHLVSAGLTWCVQHPDRSAAAGYELADVQKMFLKLA
ncbi:MAG: metal-sensitive transcriptional regulator [Microthrixaceae bacterium]